ncbi:inositol polyphosphate multikinase IPK2 [Drosophila grimshawi]|uniref:Kinase n=1 Tax=Drosophila grimshawi TaxID=7222 RepID=B4JDR7_DROGR|nr:inositol polyphosphate multikinase IPK2 [Drosophila grimshawi]EDW03437.1 GH10503 [Drosophila grimshawi]
MAKKEQENVTASPVVPMGYRQLGTQVAGHTFEATNSTAVGLLQAAGEGRVFKPLGKPECGVRELNFYESLAAATAAVATVSIASSPAGATPPIITGNNLNGAGDGGTGEADSGVLAALAAYVPRYYGPVKLVVNQREHTFINLEDLTHGMAKPCVMDVKIGRRTWDPLSSPHKRTIEEQKYVICKQNLGLCLPGFQVYRRDKHQPEETTLIRHGRDFGKSLNIEGFHKALALFFNTDSKPHCDVLLHEVLRQLRGIRSWFKRQRLLHFYASSLLICYDFEQLQSLATKPLLNGYHQAAADPVLPTTAASQWVRVRCIDFAHIFPAEDAQPDHNYMFGLQSLIDIVESMLRR